MALPTSGSVAMTRGVSLDVIANDWRQQGIYTIFGSLTTAFTPGSRCDQARGSQGVQPNLYWGAGCQNVSIFNEAPSMAITPAQTCYPDGLASFLYGNGKFKVLPFFSPGLACPSGWTATGLVTFGMKMTYTPDLGNEAATSVLKPGETIVRCCPMGYKYQDADANDLCISELPPMAAVTTSGYGNECNDMVTTLTYPRGGSYAAAQANVIHLIVPANMTFTPPLPALNADDANIADDMRQSVKIVVGITVPLAVIVLVILFFLARKQYRRKKSKQQNVGEAPPPAADYSRGPEYSGKPELEADMGGAGNRAAGAPFEKPELDHAGAQVSPRAEVESEAVRMRLPEMYGGLVARPAELASDAASMRVHSELHGDSHCARPELDASTALPRRPPPCG